MKAPDTVLAKNIGEQEVNSSSISRVLNSSLLLPLIVIALALVATTRITPIAHALGTGITKIGQIGGRAPESLMQPRGITTDSAGNVYVADTSNNRINKLNSSGELIFSIGSEEVGPYGGSVSGSGDGEFYEPHDVAIDSAGNIYVVDTYNHRIQKFDSDGVFIAKWGTNGSADGEFSSPRGIAIDPEDNIYIADTSNHRIQKFDSDGVFITKWGTSGSGDGELSGPDRIAIDSEDKIYVADNNNSRIQKFDTSGVFDSKWGTYGNNDGEFNYVNAIAIDSEDNVYVIDATNNRVQKLTSTGDFLLSIGSDEVGPYGGGSSASGTGDGEFDYPLGLAIDSADNIYVADTYNDRVQKFNSSGEFVDILVPAAQLMISYGALGVDNNNNAYLPYLPGGTSGDQSGILGFSPQGDQLASWDYGEDKIVGSTVVSNNTLYAVVLHGDGESSVTAKIVRTSLNGDVIDQWDVPGYGIDIAADNFGNIYYLDVVNPKVYTYSSSGNLISQFGSAGTGEGEINIFGGEEGAFLYTNMTADGAGNVYISDVQVDEEGTPIGGRIQRFSDDGTYISSHQEVDAFTGLSVSPQGYLYVSKMAVEDQVFTLEKYSNSFQSMGSYSPEDENFGSYSGPTAGSNGQIYLNNGEAGSIEVLCDHDVSTDDCESAGSGTDTDIDGIPDSVEDAAPNGGDANNDGTPDSGQANVASFVNLNTNEYAVLDVSQECTITSVSISPESNNKQQDSGYQYPTGMMDFILNCGEEGFTATVNQYYYNAEGEFSVRKYNSNDDSYTTIDSASVSKQTISGSSATLATYQVQDGSNLDIDGQTDGSIRDPAGLAQTEGELADTGQLPAVYILLSLLVLSTASALLVYRQRTASDLN